MAKPKQQKNSQKPAVERVAVRPRAGEVIDTERVPSPATQEQSEQDAYVTDRDRYVGDRPADAIADPQPGEETDLVGGDDTVLGEEPLIDEDPDLEGGVDEEEGEEEFQGFIEPEDSQELVPAARAHRSRVVNTDYAALERDANTLVPIIPRRTLQRTKIGGKWYNFVKGQEQFVEKAIMEHIREKGVI
jgi:hypothetical protein